MSEILLGFVGDVFVNRAKPGEVFEPVREVLSQPHILFANLEGAYADDPQPIPSSPSLVNAPLSNLSAYAEAGFDVMSLANNHIVDAGYAAMLETRSRLRAQGVKTCGAGDCLVDARKPAIVHSDGLRVAFLAYTSIFPMGCEARAKTPGVAPMRAYNFWREPFPTLHTPGMRPIITTVPDQTDLACLSDDIRSARQRADLTVVSFHWGDQTRPFHLTDHETRTARYCIEQGADLVVGHHHHALRGMEWHKGKPIMYGLGHFVFDQPWEWSEEAVSLFSQSEAGRYFNEINYTAGPREGWPFLPFPEDARLTAIAWASASQEGVKDIGFLPCRLNPDGSVRPLHLNTRECDEVVNYIEECNRTQNLNGSIVSEGAPSIAGFQTLRVGTVHA